jgi:hypothetical protein
MCDVSGAPPPFIRTPSYVPASFALNGMHVRRFSTAKCTPPAVPAAATSDSPRSEDASESAESKPVPSPRTDHEHSSTGGGPDIERDAAEAAADAAAKATTEAPHSNSNVDTNAKLTAQKVKGTAAPTQAKTEPSTKQQTKPELSNAKLRAQRSKPLDPHDPNTTTPADYSR